MCAFTHCATSCGAAGRDAISNENAFALTFPLLQRCHLHTHGDVVWRVSPDLSPGTWFALGQCCILFVAFSFWRLWCHRIFLDKEERGDTVETREDVGWCHQLPGMVTPKLRPHVQCNFEKRDSACKAGTAVGRAMFAPTCDSFRSDHNAVIGGALLCSLWQLAVLKRVERNVTECPHVRSPNELLRGKQRHSASTVHATT